MKIKAIFVFSVAVSLLVCVALFIFAIIYDYDYDYAKAFHDITTIPESLTFLFITFFSIFAGVSIFLWGFIKTSAKRKALVTLTALVIGGVFYIKMYHFSEWYFEYVVQDNPYSGKFVRDPIRDINNRAEFQREYPHLYKDTIGYSQILVNKYRGTLYGGKSKTIHDYNICIKGKTIQFIVIDDYLEYSNYCEADEENVFKPMSFVLIDLGNNSFVCNDCEEHFLPIFWKRVE